MSTFRMMSTIYKEEGFIALYKGLAASMLGLSHVAIQFPLYPSPPVVQDVTATSISVKWEPPRFCGIHPPAKVDSIQFCIDIAEGIEWKEGALNKYITDAFVAPSSYRTVFRSGTDTTCTISDLKAATWYHIRLSIEYLGVRVTSEALNIPTGRSVPATPTTPRATLIPIRSSFDLKSILPSRYEFLITWNTVVPNGSPIDRYQVQMQRLDALRQVINDEPPVTTMRPSTSSVLVGDIAGEGRGKHSHAFMNEAKAIAILTSPNTRKINQWVGSPGRSEVQIRNCLKSRGRPTSLDELRPVRSPKRRSASPTNQQTSALAAAAAVGSTAATSTKRGEMNMSMAENSPPATVWRIVYDNLNRGVRLSSPKPMDAIWLVRIRAHNKEGWSAFSPILELSWKTHPSLFVSRPVSMLGVNTTSTFQTSSSIGVGDSSSYNNSYNYTNNNSNPATGDEERTATALTEESMGSQRGQSQQPMMGQRSPSKILLTPLQLSQANVSSASQQQTPHPTSQHPSHQSTSRSPSMDAADEPLNFTAPSTINTTTNNNTMSNFASPFLPHLSTEYEHLMEKNGTSTSLMLEHSVQQAAHLPNTPTMLAHQHYRIQHLQEHILQQHSSASNSPHANAVGSDRNGLANFGGGHGVTLPQIHK
eukprot:gene8756-6294_t